jgi:IS1 family transposase
MCVTSHARQGTVGGNTGVDGEARHPPETAGKTAVRSLLSSLGQSAWGLRGTLGGGARPPPSAGMRQAAAPSAAPPMREARHGLACEARGPVRPLPPRTLGRITAVAQGPGRTMTWVLGGREAVPCPRGWATVTHRPTGRWSPEAWAVWAPVLPPQRHIRGPTDTQARARDPATTRPHRARMTRKTTVVSPSEALVQAS